MGPGVAKLVKEVAKAVLVTMGADAGRGIYSRVKKGKNMPRDSAWDALSIHELRAERARLMSELEEVECVIDERSDATSKSEER